MIHLGKWLSHELQKFISRFIKRFLIWKSYQVSVFDSSVRKGWPWIFPFLCFLWFPFCVLFGEPHHPKIKHFSFSLIQLKKSDLLYLTGVDRFNFQSSEYLNLFSFRKRCPWLPIVSYRRRKWTRQQEFKSWTRLIAFHIALIPLGKVWIQLFSLQLWVNSRTDLVLQPDWGN